ncbi:hypothetical protein, partial [Burkholderia glumae]|uniref:hypothetical protein n=1 Tax=Burkholderia glumae TaxID=337 RepID=UPI0019D6CB30
APLPGRRRAAAGSTAARLATPQRFRAMPVDSSIAPDFLLTALRLRANSVTVVMTTNVVLNIIRESNVVMRNVR